MLQARIGTKPGGIPLVRVALEEQPQTSDITEVRTSRKIRGQSLIARRTETAVRRDPVNFSFRRLLGRPCGSYPAAARVPRLPKRQLAARSRTRVHGSDAHCRDQRHVGTDPDPAVAREHLHVEVQMAAGAIGTVEIVGNDADFLAFRERLEGAPSNCALRKPAVSKGSSTGTGLRPIPVKICDVTAFSCTRAGMDRGSNPGGRRRPKKVNAGATAGWVPISNRS
jgi:hypothetical protein